MEPLVISYTPAPTLARFHASSAVVRVIIGHVGSGKTTGCCQEIKILAQNQQADRRGLRRSRWAFIRNTYPELKTTTLRTWLEWIGGETLGSVKYDYPIVQMLRWAMADGTTVELECMFISLESEDDEKKLKSMELSGIYFNELSEIAQRNFSMGIRRVGRWPKTSDGAGCTFPAIIADSNPFDTDHWAYELFEEHRPQGYELFKQPPLALKDPNGPFASLEGTRYRVNPGAENLANLGQTYVQNNIVGQHDDSIKVYVLGEYGMIADGKPVYTGYRDDIHFSREELPVYRGLPLLLGLDFGLTPTCILAQFSPRGQLRVLDELQRDGGLTRLIANDLNPRIANEYRNMKMHGWGDPAGNERAAANERTCYEELAAAGFDIAPAWTNEIGPRVKAVEDLLNRTVDGDPAILIGPRCRKLRAGFLGKYRRARTRIKGDTGAFKDAPLKDSYSHHQDALQAIALGITRPALNNAKLATQIARYNAGLTGGDRVVGY